MQRLLFGTSLAMIAVIAPLTAAMAKGTPQRGDQIPPGLEKKITNPTLGFLVAITKTVGSNSRLQDLPASP